MSTTTPSLPASYDGNRAEASSDPRNSRNNPEASSDARSHDGASMSIPAGTSGVNHTSQEHLALGRQPSSTPFVPAPSSQPVREEPGVRPLSLVAACETTSPLNNDTTSPEATTPTTPEMKPSPPPITVSKPTLSITLLLISGVRHQFVLNESYLKSHSVTVETGRDSLNDPFEMSVRQLKECIWKDWRDEWEQRPASALFIRLIHFGRMLDDKQLLGDCRLNQDSPNVVHMNIRPAETGDDEMTQPSPKGGFGRSGEVENEQRTPSCRCVIL